jgi:hypothetical protein
MTDTTVLQPIGFAYPVPSTLPEFGVFLVLPQGSGTAPPPAIVATPTITPTGGSFTGSVTVRLACATPGATIHYTTDGATPTRQSGRYTGTFTLLSDTTVRALAAKDGMTDSGIASARFTVQATNKAPVVNAGADQTITLPGTAQLDGTVVDDGLPAGTLTSTWSKLSGPGSVTFADIGAIDTTAAFSAAGTYVLRLLAHDGELRGSDEMQVVVQSALPPSVVATPTITPNGGTFTGAVRVTLATTTGGATIRYTTSGTPPTPTSTLYGAPFTLSRSATVQARAFKTGMTPSGVSRATFTIRAADPAPTPPPTPPPSDADPRLLLHWRLEEGRGLTTADASGHDFTGRLEGGPRWVTGNTGQALRFDGVNDLVRLPAGQVVETGDRFTLALWVKPEELPAINSPRLLARLGVWDIKLNSRYPQLTTAAGYSQPAYQVAWNQWQHVAVTYDQGQTVWYVNGRRQALRVDRMARGRTLPRPDRGLLLGSSGVHFAKGVLDAVHIYNRVLAAGEIAGLATTVPPPAAHVLTVPVEADARVEARRPAENFGDGRLIVDGAPQIESLLRFRVPVGTGPVTRARLRLYVVRGTPVRPQLFQTAPTWDEAKVTWNTRPARLGGAVATLGPSTTGRWLDVELPAGAIPGPGVYSFALASGHAEALWLSSREKGAGGVFPAGLVLEVQDSQ